MTTKFLTESARIAYAYSNILNESMTPKTAESDKSATNDITSVNTADLLKRPYLSKEENDAPLFRKEDHPEGFLDADFNDSVTSEDEEAKEIVKELPKTDPLSRHYLSKEENDAPLFRKEEHPEGFLTSEDDDITADDNKTNESVEDSSDNNFYVIVDYGKGWKIHCGCEFKEDAIDASKPGECPRTKDCKIKVVARVTLKKYGLDAANDNDWMKGLPEDAIAISEAIPAVAALPAAAWTAEAVASFLLAAGASAILVKNAPEFAKALNNLGMNISDGKEWLLSRIPKFEGVPYTADEEAKMMANSTVNTPSRVSQVFDDPKYAPGGDPNGDGDEKGGAIRRVVKNLLPKSKKDLFLKTPARLAGAEATKRSGDFVGDKVQDVANAIGSDTMYRVGSGIKAAGNLGAFAVSPNNIFGKGLISGLGPYSGLGALALSQNADEDKIYHPVMGQTGRYINGLFRDAGETTSEQPEDTSAMDAFKKEFGL